MEKKPFVTLEQLKEIEKTYPTPYHIYDEKGFMENARKVNEAFHGIRDLENILLLKLNQIHLS